MRSLRPALLRRGLRFASDASEAYPEPDLYLRILSRASAIPGGAETVVQVAVAKPRGRATTRQAGTLTFLPPKFMPLQQSPAGSRAIIHRIPRPVPVQKPRPIPKRLKSKWKKEYDPVALALYLLKHLKESRNVQDVLSVLEGRLEHGLLFNMVHLATAFRRLGIHAESFQAQTPAFQKLVDRCIWSLAKENVDWDAQGLAHVAWGCAKFGRGKTAKLFKAVAADSLAKVDTFEASDIALMTWAFATVGFVAPDLFEALACTALMAAPVPFVGGQLEASKVGGRLEASKDRPWPNKVSRCTPEELSNTLWAYEKAGVDSPAFFEAMASEAARKVLFFSGKQLALNCWVFAKTRTPAPAYFEAVSAEAPKVIAELNAEDLCGLVWALSTVRVSNRSLFQAIAAEALTKIVTFNPHQLAKTAWAFAEAGVAAPLLFEAVSAELPRKIMELSAQELAHVVWAFSAMGLESPRLFEAAAAEAKWKMPTLKAEDLARIVWAFASANVHAPDLFQAAATESIEKMTSFDSHQLALIARAYSTAGVSAPELFNAIEDRVRKTIIVFGDDVLAQLHHVNVLLRLDAHDSPLALLLTEHDAHLRAAYLREQPRPSQSHKDVSNLLTKLGWAHEADYTTAQGICVDMAQPALKVCIEFDGPTRYVAGAANNRGLCDVAKSKERLLRRLGWTGIRIPFHEWLGLATPAEQEDYLRDLVAALAQGPAAQNEDYLRDLTAARAQGPAAQNEDAPGV